MTPPSAKPEDVSPAEPIAAVDADASTAGTDEVAEGDSIAHLRPGAERRAIAGGPGMRGLRRNQNRPDDADSAGADKDAKPDARSDLPRPHMPGANANGVARPSPNANGVARPGPRGDAPAGIGQGPAGRPGMMMRQRRAEEERLAHLHQEGNANPQVAKVAALAAEAGRIDLSRETPAEALKEQAVAEPVVQPAAKPVMQMLSPDVRDKSEDHAEGPLPMRKPGGPAGKPGGKPASENPFSNYVPTPTAKPAKMRQRHWGLVAVFCLLVVLPGVVTAWYMYARAADQYESDIGFASRTENSSSTLSVLGAFSGLSGLGSSSGSNMDILYQFVSSQEVVRRIDKKLDLRKIFSKATNDPLLSFSPKGTIEDLVKYWAKMVIPSYDGSTGLMTIKVFAFDPQDAQNIAQALLDESTSIINELSITSQQDATKYGLDTLKKSEDEMGKAQKALTDFRISNHIVDPTDTLASAGLVVTSLVQQLGAAQVDLDMLTGTISDSDPRIATLNRRIDVIQKRITEERALVGGLSDPNAPGYANMVSQYQLLSMSNDFAQKAYMSALAAYDQAVLDAQQKTAYLATFISPTFAESSTAPTRPLWIFMASLIGFLFWATSSMIYYALRDRR